MEVGIYDWPPRTGNGERQTKPVHEAFVLQRLTYPKQLNQTVGSPECLTHRKPTYVNADVHGPNTESPCIGELGQPQYRASSYRTRTATFAM